jgi:hypothetical protein
MSTLDKIGPHARYLQVANCDHSLVTMHASATRRGQTSDSDMVTYYLASKKFQVNHAPWEKHVTGHEHRPVAIARYNIRA